jgi:hypothetical protein
MSRFNVMLKITAMFVVHPCAAQDGLPPVVAAAIRENQNECVPSGRVRFGPKFIGRQDINGDGVKDFILDYSHATCGAGETHFCGTGGCFTQVFASRPDGSFVRVLSDTVRNISFKRLKGRHAMALEVHGIACGRPGTQSCREILFWNGDRFSHAF